MELQTKSYNQKILDYQQLVQKMFNVKNPFLLKTGTLGTLINILALQHEDSKQYFTKIFQEMHPLLANDFNSMIFHSNFYGVNIDFAEPAKFNAYIEIPIISGNFYYYKYVIDKNTPFKDSYNFDFMITDKIEISISQTDIKAIIYRSNGIVEHLNTKIGTNNFGVECYYVEIDNIIQIKRDLYINNIPYYDYGKSYNYTINIDNYKKINSVKTWLQRNKDLYLEKALLYKYGSNEFVNVFNKYDLIPLNIKYNNINSTKFDNDIFMEIKESYLIFKTGDGVNGKHLKEDEKVITEIITTEGEYGNFEKIEFLIENINVLKVDAEKNETYFKTTLSGKSITSGKSGKSIESPTSVKQKIFHKISERNSLVTINDFELAFQKNNTKPFIDTKFLNNGSIIFIMDQLKYNDVIIDTTSKNMNENYLAFNPFFPEMNYNGIDMISPFYYKRSTNNLVSAYTVNPKINVNLYTQPGISQQILIENNVKLTIEYDFIKRKSFFILSNTHDRYTYKLKTNQFEYELNYGNNFRYEVNTLFTDDYCIIKKEINNVYIEIYDDLNNFILKSFNISDNFHQLEFSQHLFKFNYESNEDINNNYSDEEETVTLNYLDNELEDITGTIEELYEPYSNNLIPYILRMPFLSKKLFENLEYADFYNLIKSFFTLNNYQEKLPLTLKCQQSFYDSIKIDHKYSKYVFEQTDMDITSNKIPIVIELVIDKSLLFLSKYNDVNDVIFEVKTTTIKKLLDFEGFRVKLFETDIEKEILQTINNEYDIIKNIKLLSPSQFIVNDPNTVYSKMYSDMPVEEILDFVPPYFHYDYENIKIETKLI